MPSLHPILNSQLTWHDSKSWNEALLLINRAFVQNMEGLSEVVHIAGELRKEIDSVDGFIQKNTAKICPNCRKVCCINKHGYYDHHDLIYITALGLKPPAYGSGIKDTEPCQFLCATGCTIDRSIRPFRCNWHFCSELIDFMNSGPAKPLRAFNERFRALQTLRHEMVERFFEVIG
ncbi:MAG TPA: hypothetical protein VK448_03125 [Dissulfurispiraceae bacterium]|nr:hypothetical protein [Dissulfurispiraceae bacterium]